MALKIPISFAEDEVHIYNYIKSKRSYSVYIKDLVEEDMKKNGYKSDRNDVDHYKRPEHYTRTENDLGIDF